MAGPREPVPTIRAARVREAVRAEWESRSHRRTIRRRIALAASLVAAAAVLVAVTGRIGPIDTRPVPQGEPVAIVERIDGVPRRIAQEGDRPVTTRLAPKDAVRTGELIETDAHARIAIQFLDGTSVRLDTGSDVRPIAGNIIELIAGAVYIDTRRESGGFEVRTGTATARDIGTQFEVRLVERSVRVRVRSGVVELSDRTRSVTGRAGTEITLLPTGAVSRPFAAHGPEWEWTAAVSPALEIEGVSLGSFLDRIVREQGWTVQYADAALAREAATIVLHGSVRGLSPREALDVALATSGLRHRLEDGELVILRGTGAR
jgi:ferric-dicitrate binding protein FerR (iron transport regulator)